MHMLAKPEFIVLYKRSNLHPSAEFLKKLLNRVNGKFSDLIRTSRKRKYDMIEKSAKEERWEQMENSIKDKDKIIAKFEIQIEDF